MSYGSSVFEVGSDGTVYENAIPFHFLALSFIVWGM